MPDLPTVLSADGILPGEGYLADTPVLAAHAGTQPDLFLRWNAIPLAAEAIDVVVHLHGFSQQGSAMPLAEKVGRSGLDLAGRTRPTLALLPRGNWIRHTWYDFPALLDGGLDRLVEYALGQFGGMVRRGAPPNSVHARPWAGHPREADGNRLVDGRAKPGHERVNGGGSDGGFSVDRLVLTGHSGGGMPAVDALAGLHRPPDELHIFDGLYGRDPANSDPMRGIETLDAWLGDRLAQEPGRPGALRVVYIERQTGPFSRQVGALIARRLAGAEPGIGADLARRYRVEPSGVPHAYVAAICGPPLLARADAAFDWARMV